MANENSDARRTELRAVASRINDERYGRPGMRSMKMQTAADTKSITAASEHERRLTEIRAAGRQVSAERYGVTGR